jgi:predicted DNA-binding transcriptional regulator AlpA
MQTTNHTNAKLLNQKQVAQIIGLSEAWLERKRWEGGGIPYRKLGRCVRYDEQDVMLWIDAHGKRHSTSDVTN